jgi:hypothetical protein
VFLYWRYRGLWGFDSSTTILLINNDTEESARKTRRRKGRRKGQEALNEIDDLRSYTETARSWECDELSSV